MGLLSPSETSEMDSLRGAVQAAGKTHSSGRSRCGKQDWTIFTGVSSDYDCFSDKQNQVQETAPVLFLHLAVERAGVCWWGFEAGGNLQSQTQ